MIETYLFYTFLLIFMLLFSYPVLQYSNSGSTYKITEYRDVFINIIIVFYALIIGTRYYVGVDYDHYINWYKELLYTGIFPEDKEFGYVFLNNILYFFEAHYSILFIIIALLQIIFYYKSLEKFPQLILWFTFFFFTSLLMFSSMNLMRQTLAFFVFFYAFNLGIEKKYYKAMIWCLFGFSFHKSIIFAIALYPFCHFDWFKNKYWQIALLILLTAFSSQVLDSLLKISSPIVNLLGYGYYIDNLDIMYEITEENAAGSGFGKYLFFFIDIVIILYSNILKKEFKSFDFYKYYNLYFLGALFDKIVYDNFILARTNDYLLNFRILILSFLCHYLYKNRKKRYINIVLLVVILTVLLGYFYRGINNSAALCSPFKTIFS